MNHRVIIWFIVLVTFGQGHALCQDLASLERELKEVKRQLQELKEAGCQPKSGMPKLDISGESYTLHRQGGARLMLMTKGTVKNSGTGDARNVIITTDCPECASTGRNGAWMDASVVLKSRTGTMIAHVPAGASREFSYPAALRVNPVSFGGIMRSAPSKPRGLKTRIVSFDPVGK